MGNQQSETLIAKPFTEGRPDTEVVVCASLQDVSVDLGRHPLLIVDSNVASRDDVRALCEKTTRMGGTMLVLTAGEEIKEFEYYTGLREGLEISEYDVLVIVGGGTVINLGLHLGSELHIMNSKSPVIIPTNTMSFADVAIGSLGLINRGGVKNKLKTVCDPTQVVVCKDVFDGAPLVARTDGMIEVVKHALFQDPSILNSSLAAFLRTGNENEYFALATRAMKLKIELQNAIISGNKSLDHLLTYGHLHAHILEEYFNYTIKHSIGVYTGLMIDLMLAGHESAFDLLVHAPENNTFKSELGNLLERINLPELKIIYSHQVKYMNGDRTAFQLVYVPMLGFYGDLRKQVILKDFTFEQIADVYARLKDLFRV